MDWFIRRTGRFIKGMSLYGGKKVGWFKRGQEEEG